MAPDAGDGEQSDPQSARESSPEGMIVVEFSENHPNG